MPAGSLPAARVEAPDQLDSRSDLQLIAAINASEDLALDVMQETFLYFLRKFPGFRLTANLKTFFYPAVKNLSIAARRQAARYQGDEAAQEQIERTPAPA